MSQGRKRSIMWKHFSNDSNKKAKCKHCSRVISISGGAQGNLNRHMRGKHPSILGINAQPSEEEDATLISSFDELDQRNRSTVWIHFSKENNKKAKCKYCFLLLSIAGRSHENLKRHLRESHPRILCMKQQPSEDEDNCTEINLVRSPLTSRPSSPSRKRRNVWTHFSPENNKKAKCNYCACVISTAGGINGNLSRHLKRKHLSIFASNKLLTEDETDSVLPYSQLSEVKRLPSTSKSTILPLVRLHRQPLIQQVDHIDRQLIKMIAKGYHTLRIVEEPEFRKLIEMLSDCGDYLVPKSETLSQKLVPAIYNELLSDIKQQINASQAVCLTTDAWTSRNNEDYITITAHFLDPSTRLCSALIACKEYSDGHTSEDVYNFLKEAMAEWQISNKISAVVTDNTTNIITAVKLGEWQSVKCFASLLNLVVQKATQKIADTLLKVIGTQEAMKLPELKLKQDVSTRWSCTYTMLEHIVNIKDAAISSPNVDLAIDSKDWIVIDEVLTILKPFYEVTSEISAEKNVALSKIIVVCNLLQGFLATSFPKDAKVKTLLSVLKNEMHTQFQYLEHNCLYAECTILDPRFKQRGFQNIDAYKNALTALRNKLVPEIKDEQNNAPDLSYTDEPQNTTRSIWDSYDQEIQKSTKPVNNFTAANRELDKYLNEDYLDRKRDPLQWWEEYKTIYPHLYAFILKRFCIVASSVPCQRIFSHMGQILNERRSLLESEEVSKLVFLHNNM